MTLQATMRSVVRYALPATGNVAKTTGQQPARQYTDLQRRIALSKACDRDPTVCSCMKLVDDGSAQKLLAIFRNLSKVEPPLRPVRYVEVLKKLGGRKEMDRLFHELGLADRVQLVQCAKAWAASKGSLQVPGRILEIAFSHSQKRHSII